MAPRNQETPFAILCPELVDRVLENVIADKGSTLGELAQVNKMFRDSACRCSGALRLKGGVFPANRGHLTQMRPQVAGVASDNCDDKAEVEVLSEAIRSRPKLSKLVLEWSGVASKRLWPALLTYSWTSVVLRQARVYDVFPTLAESRFTLKTMIRTLWASDTREVSHDVHRTLQAFPMLETLTLFLSGGASFSAEDCSLTPEVQANKLSSLTFAGGVFWHWWDAFRVLPASCTDLERLSFHCCHDYRGNFPPMAAPPPEARTLCSNLTKLQTIVIDISDTLPTKFVVEGLTEHCRYLRHVQVFASPDRYRGTRAHLDSPKLWKLVENCPDLERLIVSQTEVTIDDDHFRRLARQHQMVPVHRNLSYSEIRFTILLLTDSAVEAELSSLSCSLKELSVFRCIVPQQSYYDNIRRDDPRLIAESFSGESATVQSWCKSFCKHAWRRQA